MRKKINLFGIIIFSLIVSILPIYASTEYTFSSEMNTQNNIVENMSAVGTIRDKINEQIQGINWGIGITLPSIDNGYGEGNYFTDEGLSDAAGMSNYIADSAMDGIVSWIADKYMKFVSTFAQFLLHNYKPSLAVFDEHVGTTGITMFENFIYIGYVIAFCLYVFMLIMVGFGAIKLAEIKESPYQLTGLFICSILLIFLSPQISQGLMTIAESLWDFVGSGAVLTANVENLNGLLAPFGLVRRVFSFNGSLLIILSIIFGIVFLIQFIKLIMEVIERYIVACFLSYLFPIPAGCIVSKNASGIFKKYLQMYLVQLFMLILNLIFLTIILAMCGRVLVAGPDDIILEWFFLFGILKVAQKIDNYAYTMGLSVATTGGGVLDSIGMTIGNMAFMARGLQHGMGIAGATMAKGGAASGNMELLGMGRKLHGAANLQRHEDMTSFGNLRAAEQMGNLKDVAKNLQASHIDDSIINAALTGAGFQQLNATSTGFKTELLKQAYGAESVLKNAGNIDSINFDKLGRATVSTTKMSSNGKEYKEILNFSQNPNNLKGNIQSLQNSNGDQVYFSSMPSMRAGDEIGFSSNMDISNAELASGIDFNLLGDAKKSVTSVQKADDGSHIFNGVDGVVARMDREGNIAFNNRDHEWDVQKIGSLKGLRDVKNIRIEDNGNGTATLIGEDVVNKGQYKEYTLFNKAVYSREDTATVGKFRTSFGANNSNTGNYMVIENNTDNKNSSYVAQSRATRYMGMKMNDHITIKRG